MTKKKIVILGAGFGGLRAALTLAKEIKRRHLENQYEILLVDRNDHHTYTPLLYEVATTSKMTADYCKLYEISSYKVGPILAALPVAFREAEVERIDIEDKSIRMKRGEAAPFDFLVIALGSAPNFYGLRGLNKHAIPLKSFYDAIKIREAIFEHTADGAKEIRVVIGGAGPTGVEFAGEVMMLCGEFQKEFSNCRLTATLIEGSPTILPGFSREMRERAEKRLAKLGVAVLAGEPIKEAKEGKVVMKDGKEVPFDVFAWTGGNKPCDPLEKTALLKNPRGGLKVHPTMHGIFSGSSEQPAQSIYVIGDAVELYHPETGARIPAVARAAISQANVAAHNILEEIRVEQKLAGSPKFRRYRPMDYPYILPVGGKYAIAKFGPVVINGFWGWVLKGLVELNYLVSIMSIQQALRTWLKGLKIFMQNDRLG